MLPTIYYYLNELCGFVKSMDAFSILGCRMSSGDRMYRLFATPYLEFDPFVEHWIFGHSVLCLHVLLFS